MTPEKLEEIAKKTGIAINYFYSLDEYRPLRPTNKPTNLSKEQNLEDAPSGSKAKKEALKKRVYFFK